MAKINVILPIKELASIIFTFKKANVIPTANASILVAIAKTKISFTSNFVTNSSSSLSFLNDSKIILPPIINNKIKAIQ